VGDITCHQPPIRQCEQSSLEIEGIRTEFTECKLKVGEHISHIFDHKGFMVAIPIPPDCLDPPFKTAEYPANPSTAVNKAKAIKPGVVLIAFADLQDLLHPPYLEVVRITPADRQG
jgi:hypothetical protein